jgi:uridine kinase
MESLATQGLPIRVEHWLVDEARAHFLSRGWEHAARLLTTARTATVPLATCGQVYAIALGPVVPDTSLLTGATVRVHGDALALELGALDPRRRGVEVQVRLDPEMVVEHRRWTTAMGVTSVGAFNELCIDGEVTQLIRVAEGFHEKQISRLADAIAANRERLRIICIAGPSSSGKTTFIKRLSVQLHINGLRPVALSLDDYYVDRLKNPKDENGEWDFEAVEALRLDLLQDHVRRLLAGESVKLARYDFKTGLSHPDGGHTLQLQPGDLLLLEGIHGLNPRLLGDIHTPEQLFRVFIHPATSLPFDRLSRVSTTDLRLLRRIVRDRHTRGYSAAENIARWPSVQAGEQKHIFPFQARADFTFDSALVYEPAVLKVFAERYLLEVPPTHPSFATAWRLRHLVDRFVAIYPDHVPPTSMMREFIGGSGFEY